MNAQPETNRHAVSQNDDAAATLVSMKPSTRLLKATVRKTDEDHFAQAATVWPPGRHTHIAIIAGRYLPNTGLRPQRSRVTQAADVIGASPLLLRRPNTVAFIGRSLAAACYLTEPTGASKAPAGAAARKLIERIVHRTRPFARPSDNAKPHIPTHCGPGAHRRSVAFGGTPRRGFGADESEPR